MGPLALSTSSSGPNLVRRPVGAETGVVGVVRISRCTTACRRRARSSAASLSAAVAAAAASGFCIRDREFLRKCFPLRWRTPSCGPGRPLEAKGGRPPGSPALWASRAAGYGPGCHSLYIAGYSGKKNSGFPFVCKSYSVHTNDKNSRGRVSRTLRANRWPIRDSKQTKDQHVTMQKCWFPYLHATVKKVFQNFHFGQSF